MTVTMTEVTATTTRVVTVIVIEIYSDNSVKHSNLKTLEAILFTS